MIYSTINNEFCSIICFCGKLIKGKFPDENTNEDGFDWVAPVDAFPAQNKYGKE